MRQPRLPLKYEAVRKKDSIENLVSKFSRDSFQPLEIHETVEECMIFANHWVAKKIAEAFPSAALVRCHPCLIN